MTTWLRAGTGAHALDCTIDVLVQPRASRPKIGPVHGDRLKIAVSSPPVDGEANAAVIDLLAEALALPRSAIAVIAGQSSRRKTIRLHGLSVAAAQARLLP